MANSEDFAETEWAAICDAAHGAGLAMMLVGGSGLVGSMREMLVAGRTSAAGAEHANELIRGLCTAAVMGAMRVRVAAVWQVGVEPRLALQEAVIGWLREAVAAWTLTGSGYWGLRIRWRMRGARGVSWGLGKKK